MSAREPTVRDGWQDCSVCQDMCEAIASVPGETVLETACIELDRHPDHSYRAVELSHQRRLKQRQG